MDDSKKYRLRVSYVKTNRLAFLSHLETARAIESSIRRADLPYMTTNGFNPHMKLSFGRALPVGVSSEAEIYDLSLKEYVKPGYALKILKKSISKDLMPYSADYISRETKSATCAYTGSTYIVSFLGPLKKLTYPSKIVIHKKNKDKIIDVNSFLRSNFELINSKDGIAKFIFSVNSLDGRTLNPLLLIYESIKLTHIDPDCFLSIKKTKNYIK